MQVRALSHPTEFHGLDFELRPILPRTGQTKTAEFTALNARQKIPLLEDNGLILTESAAIITYLSDTYGQAQVAYFGKENVTFTLPEGQTVITPDCIAILKNAPHLELAQHFIDFILSREGQETVAKEGSYLPLTAAVAREQLGKLD